MNVGSMTGRGQQVVDFMERTKINIMCVQETKWKGSKSRELGNGFKLFYIGEDGCRNGVGIITRYKIQDTNQFIGTLVGWIVIYIIHKTIQA